MCGHVSKSLYSAVKSANKSRAQAKMTVSLTTLKNDGTPSKTHDATVRHETVEAAMESAAYRRSLNPGRTLRFAIDGTEV